MPVSSYVFCDTDSMAIVAQEAAGSRACVSVDGEQILAVSFEDAELIVERFASLNPYDRTIVPGSILEIEKENFDDAMNRHQLWCWSISAKRYVLFTRHQEAGTVDLVKVSEHGLGHLLNPKDPSDESTTWIDEAWYFILCNELEIPVEEPPWLDRPALTRVTASGPTVLEWFAEFNRGKDFPDQIKPANFLLLAHPDSRYPSTALPMTPFQRDATKWLTNAWTDRRTGDRIRITTEPFDGMDRKGTIRVRTYRDVLADFLIHPEAKSLGPGGEHVARDTRGLLQRRAVEGIQPAVRIGKESNRLDERLAGLVTHPREYRVEYVESDHDDWTVLVLPVLTAMKRSEVARRSGLHRRTIERLLLHAVRPRRAHKVSLTAIAVEHARQQLAGRGDPSADSERAALHRYLTDVNAHP